MANGDLRETISLFPFEIEKIRKDRAFPIIFQSRLDGEQGKWKTVSQKSLSIRPKIIRGYSSGERIIKHQRLLLSMYRSEKISSEELKIISDTYFSLINKENGDIEAGDYLMQIYESKL